MPGLIGLRCVAQDWVGPSLRFCTGVGCVGPSSQDGCCDTFTYTLGASVANRIRIRRYSAIDVAPEDDPLASLLEAVSATPAVWSAPINDEAALRVAGAA